MPPRKKVSPLDLPNQSVPFLENLLTQFALAAARKFSIPEDDLLQLEPERFRQCDESSGTTTTCIYYMTTKKKCCGNTAMSNGYCNAHQNYATLIETQIPMLPSGRIQTKKTPKLKPITKTEAALLESMNNAVPQMVTKLKKSSKGPNLLMDPITEILFDNTYMVVGIRNGTKISKLSNHEVEICEQKGWKYLDDVVEDSDCESDGDSDSSSDSD